MPKQKTKASTFTRTAGLVVLLNGLVSLFLLVVSELIQDQTTQTEILGAFSLMFTIFMFLAIIYAIYLAVLIALWLVKSGSKEEWEPSYTEPDPDEFAETDLHQDVQIEATSTEPARTDKQPMLFDQLKEGAYWRTLRVIYLIIGTVLSITIASSMKPPVYNTQTICDTTYWLSCHKYDKVVAPFYMFVFFMAFVTLGYYFLLPRAYVRFGKTARQSVVKQWQEELNNYVGFCGELSPEELASRFVYSVRTRASLQIQGELDVKEQDLHIPNAGVELQGYPFLINRFGVLVKYFRQSGQRDELFAASLWLHTYRSLLYPELRPSGEALWQVIMITEELWPIMYKRCRAYDKENGTFSDQQLHDVYKLTSRILKASPPRGLR